MTIALAPSAAALVVTHWHDGAWTDFVLPHDAHGLPVMTAEQYRALAPLVGWPVATTNGGTVAETDTSREAVE